MNIINKKIELSDGRVIEIETGKLAKQADGSVVVKMGGTMLLATVCAAKEVKEGTDFMPLTVDYKEKYYAAGRFPGGFMKREGKSSDYEILVSRLIDRPIRPLWPDDYHLETFVNVTLISADKDTQPDALAGLAASCALATSDLPFGGPIGEVRVCRIDGQFVINPTFSEMEKADLELMVAATEENIMMVEGEMKEVSEHDMLEAIKFAHEEIKKHCRVQKELMHELGTDLVKRDYPHDPEDEDLKKQVYDYCYDKCYALAKSAKPKHEREDGFTAIKDEFIATLPEPHTEEEKEEYATKVAMATRYYNAVEKEAMRNMVLDEGVRLDGRSTTEVRPIWCEVDYLPCAHGSAIFTRGETQALASVTLGTKLDMKETDEVLMKGEQQFVLHYNFPSSQTAPLRRLLSAEVASHSWTQVSRSASRSPVLQWVLSPTPRSPMTAMQSSPTFSAMRTTSATWTSRLQEPRTVSPLPRWTSRSTASHTRSSKRLSSRLVKAACTSWAR